MHPTPQPECPFCDQPFTHWQLLAVHLIDFHHSDRLANGRTLYLSPKNTVLCWCGAYFKLGPRIAEHFIAQMQCADWTGRWAQHLQRRGGAGRRHTCWR